MEDGNTKTQMEIRMMQVLCLYSHHSFIIIINHCRPVYNESNCYKFIKVSNQQRSCIDAQRECEMIGGNITVMNSVEEYDQLTDSVLYVLRVLSRSKFNVHVESELPQKNLNKGCVIIDVYDGTFYPNYSENINCSATDEINTIVCESTDSTPEICQEVTSTDQHQKTSRLGLTTSRLDLTTPRLYLTKNVNATVSNANSVTNTPNNLLETTPWYELNTCHGLVVDIIIVLSTVIITVVVMCFLIFLRNKLKTSGRKQDSDSNGKSINQDTHQNELYQLSSQKHGAAVPSTDQSTLYHDTVVPPVDSGASVPLYHDIVVPAKSEQCVDDPNSSYIEIIN
ncbi:uncharacterized protein [Antedon mediterranea]|uniref:uncharacterized protein isoform X2 n=1 Tax=Antedon mediterranea TaxID=105859 RepID=UPI003AF64E18